MISYYQVGDNLIYRRREATKYERRVFLDYHFTYGGVIFVQTLGFKQGYEFGYALGVF